MNIINFRSRLLREENLEQRLEVVPTRDEERRLFNAYMAAIRKQVAMNDEVDEAHRAWMKAAGQLPNTKT